MLNLQAITAILAFAAASEASGVHNHAHLAKRQQSSAAASSSTSSSAASGTSAATAPPAAASNDPLGSLTAAISGVPSVLSLISSGMSTGPEMSATTTFAAGVKPTGSASLPALPSPFTYTAASWPKPDTVPDINSPEVTEWLKELNGVNVPNIPKNVDNTCQSNPQAAADAAKNGWWTCGGHTRDTDIVQCPDKLTWGVSFDDGPSPYTPKLLDFLAQKKLSATFFVVGSRIISRPDILREEYIAGHEISVHTWSHTALTTLSNEQIVAELGWTRKAIKDVTGVTPLTMRPPYGDMDDRVRAISLAMGMIPISWTTAPSGAIFDTNDWRVAGGLSTSTQQYRDFQDILGNATAMNTGFIVLQHDLFEVTVDLAVGYTLDAALKHNPPFNLLPIGQCSKIPATNLYLETNTNKTFPAPNKTATDTNGDGKPDTHSGSGSNTTKNSAFILSSPISTYALAAFALLGAALL